MNEVSIFDNLNTYIEQVVYITKNIVHLLFSLPDLIGDGMAVLSDFLSYCPPFLTWLFLFMAGSGIVLKGTHWGG